MPTKRYALKTEADFATQPEWSAAQIARLHRILDSQLGGALEALGTGIVADPDETSFLVEAVTGGVSVQPGRAFVRHSALGGCFLHLDVELLLDDLEPDTDLYIFAALDIGEDNDSRESAAPIILVQEGDACDGGALLARRNADGTVDDLREPFSIDALLNRTTQLEDDLGYDASERTKGSVAARLNLLGGDEGGAVVAFLEQLKYSVADPRNAVVVIEEKLAILKAELLEVIQNGGTRPRQTPLDQLFHEHALTRQMAIRLGTLSPVTEADAERSQSANVVGRADGSIYGDGSLDHPDFIATNLTINADGSLEP
jgi:hypothetical protein